VAGAPRRRDAAARREAPFAAATAWLEHRSVRLEPLPPWVDTWVADRSRTGLVTSWADGTDLLQTALALLEERGSFTGDGAPRSFMARTELAATIAGDAHALDEGSRLAALVLRAAAARAGTGPPTSASERRVLWESLGVVNDRVSTTCLVWGLAGQEHRVADRVPGPTHLTWWDLDEGFVLPPRPVVLICENPRTLEALAALGPPDLGVVCTMGRPNLVVTEVLGRLAGSDARLFYHGDFDWPGVAMANAAVERFRAQPWLMGASDYLAGRGSQPLKGAPVEPLWDPELGPAMRHRGVAVHEEAALDRLVGQVFRLIG
jgi:uncharacterized protein (TIGR02679 family)